MAKKSQQPGKFRSRVYPWSVWLRIPKGATPDDQGVTRGRTYELKMGKDFHTTPRCFRVHAYRQAKSRGVYVTVEFDGLKVRLQAYTRPETPKAKLSAVDRLRAMFGKGEKDGTPTPTGGADFSGGECKGGSGASPSDDK